MPPERRPAECEWCQAVTPHEVGESWYHCTICGRCDSCGKVRPCSACTKYDNDRSWWDWHKKVRHDLAG